MQREGFSKIRKLPSSKLLSLPDPIKLGIKLGKAGEERLFVEVIGQHLQSSTSVPKETTSISM